MTAWGWRIMASGFTVEALGGVQVLWGRLQEQEEQWSSARAIAVLGAGIRYSVPLGPWRLGFSLRGCGLPGPIDIRVAGFEVFTTPRFDLELALEGAYAIFE